MASYLRGHKKKRYLMTLTYDSHVKMMSIELHDNGRSLKKKKIPYDPNLEPSRKDGTIPVCGDADVLG